MRLFLAIDLPEHLKKELAAQISPLQKEYKQFSWVDPKNYHITLHFIGEVADPKDIIAKTEEALFDTTPFQMFAADADLFMHRKIILHVGFSRSKELEQAVEELRTSFQSEERLKYIPHLTIARYKIPSKQQYLLLKKKLQQLPIELEFMVDTITLFESISGSRQPIYKKLAEFHLEK